MTMYYVYILLSRRDGKFYIGYSRDLKRRIKEHKLGKVKSTKHRKPLLLALYEGYNEKGDAKRRKRFLKRSEGKRLLRRQLKTFLERNCDYGGSP